VTGIEIVQIEASDKPSRSGPEVAPISEKVGEFLSGSAWLFFPEVLVAAGLLLATPIWAVRLLMDGHGAVALGLISISAAGFAVAWFAWQKQSKGLMYLAILVVLLGGWLGFSVTPAAK